MSMRMPFARAINPITKTNWEGVGVKPHFEVAADKALEKAIELAKSGTTKLASKGSPEMEQTETSSFDAAVLEQKANSLMGDESFAEAAVAFGKLAKNAPDTGRFWFRYAYCLHMNGEPDKALEFHKRAAMFDQFAGIATYNIACVHAMNKRVDKAFEALEEAVELGFGGVSQLDGDTDLDNIREDERYAKLIEKIEDRN
jgi:tetratricopeptide (TPR) repeat protein